MGDRTYFYATVYTYCIDGGQHIICLCNCIYLLNRWGREHSSLQLYILHMYIDGDRTYFYATVHAYSVDGRTEHISTLLNVQLGGGQLPWIVGEVMFGAVKNATQLDPKNMGQKR